MNQAFLKEIERMGSPYLVEFATQRKISRPEDLIHTLEDHAGNLQAIAEKGEERGESPKELAGQFEGVMGGFESQEDELAHVHDLLSQLRERYGAQA